MKENNKEEKLNQGMTVRMSVSLKNQILSEAEREPATNGEIIRKALIQYFERKSIVSEIKKMEKKILDMNLKFLASANGLDEAEMLKLKKQILKNK